MVWINDTEIAEVYASFPIQLWTAVSLGSNILGTLGNALTMAVVAIVKDFHKPNYLLLSGVCVSDFALNAFHMPFENLQSHYLLFERRLLGTEAFCIWESAAYAVFYTASVIGQMLVACNRFMAVFMPLFYRKYFTNRSAFIVWLLACMLFPVVYFYGGYSTWVVYRMDTLIGDCREFTVNMPTLVLSLLTIYLPLSISLGAYCAIFLRLLLSAGANRSEILRRSRGSGAMCTCSVILLVSMFPQWIIGDTGQYNSVSFVHYTMWIKFLFRLSYAVNPIFYFGLDGRMRRGVVVMVKKHILRLPGSQQLTIRTENPGRSTVNAE